MDEKEKREQDMKRAVIAAGLISCGLFVAYRLGVKRGYKDAMSTIEGTMDCLIDAFTKF